MDTSIGDGVTPSATFWVRALHLFAEDGDQEMVEACFAEVVKALASEGK